MKRILLLAVPFLLIQAAVADDQLRNVQTELKNQGFYYGDVNGQESTETSAAIRRYQIRNGLQVTGTLNAETVHALGVRGGVPKTQVAPPSPSAPSAPAPAQPAPRRPNPEENDRNFLKQEEQKNPDSERPNQPPPYQRPYDRSVVPPPAPVTAPEGDFAILYASTPYFNAPRQVQQETLRRAQAILAEQGFYRDSVTGVPGPGTEEALLRFQRRTRLPLSGRLDLQTLAELRLLPGRGLANPPLQPFYPNNNSARDYSRPRVYRGIQVD